MDVLMKSFVIVHIRNGEITNRAAVAKWYKEMSDGKHIWESSKCNKRSLPQNAYLHGVLIPEFKNALRSVAYDEVKTDEQAKEIMKRMFLVSSVVNKETGEVLEYVKSTSELTKEEMSNLINEVIKFAAENMNYQIPFPNEQSEMFT